MPTPDEPLGFLRAAAHPLRLRIMSLLTGAELSAAEVARELGTTQANASYHLRLLERAGQVQVAGIEQVRGGRAKKYRYAPSAPPSPADVVEAGGEAELALLDALFLELKRRVTTKDVEAPAYFADAEVWVEAGEAREIRRELNRLGRRVHAAARPPRTPGTVAVSYVTHYFQEKPCPD